MRTVARDAVERPEPRRAKGHDMPDRLNALRASVDRLTSLVRPLDDDAVTRPAYPVGWTIADVLSHLGSAAVISRRMVADTLSGARTPDDFNAAAWAEWNDKSPRAKTDDGLAAIEAFTSGLEAVSRADRKRFALEMGPLELDWDAAVGMRLNEQVVHEWDVAVAIDSSATLPDDGAALVIDNLELIARFTAKPHGDPAVIEVATTRPDRAFAVVIEPDTVTLSPLPSATDPNLTMPAEGFVRLVYGRLDAEHTPATVTGDTTDVRAYAATNPNGTALFLFNDNETLAQPVTITLSGKGSTGGVTVTTYDKAIYDLSGSPTGNPPDPVGTSTWAPPSVTNLGAQSLPLTLTLTPWSMNMVIIQ